MRGRGTDIPSCLPRARLPPCAQGLALESSSQDSGGRHRGTALQQEGPVRAVGSRHVMAAVRGDRSVRHDTFQCGQAHGHVEDGLWELCGEWLLKGFEEPGPALRQGWRPGLVPGGGWVWRTHTSTHTHLCHCRSLWVTLCDQHDRAHIIQARAQSPACAV